MSRHNPHDSECSLFHHTTSPLEALAKKKQVAQKSTKIQELALVRRGTNLLRRIATIHQEHLPPLAEVEHNVHLNERQARSFTK